MTSIKPEHIALAVGGLAGGYFLLKQSGKLEDLKEQLSGGTGGGSGTIVNPSDFSFLGNIFDSFGSVISGIQTKASSVIDDNNPLNLFDNFRTKADEWIDDKTQDYKDLVEKGEEKYKEWVEKGEEKYKEWVEKGEEKYKEWVGGFSGGWENLKEESANKVDTFKESIFRNLALVGTGIGVVSAVGIGSPIIGTASGILGLSYLFEKKREDTIKKTGKTPEKLIFGGLWEAIKSPFSAIPNQPKGITGTKTKTPIKISMPTKAQAQNSVISNIIARTSKPSRSGGSSSGTLAPINKVVKEASYLLRSPKTAIKPLTSTQKFIKSSPAVQSFITGQPIRLPFMGAV